MDEVNVGEILSLILKSVAIKTGCSSYNCMVVGAILGATFGLTQFSPDLFDLIDGELVTKINIDILDIIKVM